jgi:hypothetical protein
MAQKTLEERESERLGLDPAARKVHAAQVSQKLASHEVGHAASGASQDSGPTKHLLTDAEEKELIKQKHKAIQAKLKAAAYQGQSEADRKAEAERKKNDDLANLQNKLMGKMGSVGHLQQTPPAPAHPLKAAVEAAPAKVQLKHVEPAHDASAPKIESWVQVKKVDRQEFKQEIAKAPTLKPVEQKRDASAPRVEPGVVIKERPANQRPVFLASVERAAEKTAAASPVEKSLKGIETGLRVVDAAAKSVANNQQNLKDAENKEPGASTVEEAQKMLATAQDLFTTQLKNLQLRYNMAANEWERAPADQRAGDLLERWNGLKVSLKAHGLSTV